jgi:hypothetical protein
MFGIGSLSNLLKPIAGFFEKLTHASDDQSAGAPAEEPTPRMEGDAKTIKTPTQQFDVPAPASIQEVDLGPDDQQFADNTGIATTSAGTKGRPRPAQPTHTANG